MHCKAEMSEGQSSLWLHVQLRTTVWECISSCCWETTKLEAKGEQSTKQAQQQTGMLPAQQSTIAFNVQGVAALVSREDANSDKPALLSGSAIAPCSYERESGILKQKSAGWSTYLAKEPCTGGVAKNLTLGSKLYRPCLHKPSLLCTRDL